MALETRLYQKLSQQLVMTPQLRQAIKILQVSRAELETLIDEELTQNPMLEEGAEVSEQEERPRTEEPATTDGSDPDSWNSGSEERDTTAEVSSNQQLDGIDWKEYLDNYRNDWHSASATAADYDEDKRPSLENTLARTPSLTEHLSWQLRMGGIDPAEESAAAVIIGNMDKDGYLHVSVEDIAFQMGLDYDLVEHTLQRIQELDPPGVGARTLSECLLLQIRADTGTLDSLAARIARDHLSLLESKRYDRVAKECGTSIEDVVAAAHYIATLEPKPGRNFGEGDIRYIIPDVFVQKIGDELVITLNDEGLPRLRVSNFYRQVLGETSNSDAKRYVQEKMRAAAWLIKSIQQRQRTLYLVTQSIVQFQREFFDHGVSHLKPLVLKDVAVDIGMHESTVSRATANKYVHTPQGTFELKYFFTSSLQGADGEEVSAESVKDRIRELVASEDPRRPLSDQYIAKVLSTEHVGIARRTVAKYRSMMGLLPSSKRRQAY